MHLHGDGQQLRRDLPDRRARRDAVVLPGRRRTRSRPPAERVDARRWRRLTTRTSRPRRGCRSTTSSFTSEVRYWFQYDSTKTYTLDFTGDDDVWVFINRKLAVDLGGIHTPVQGSVTFGAGAAAKFGLTNGQVYEVAVFQAERQTNGSSYRLTLSGFNAAPSECRPVCGDGIIGIGEECDDGKNAGGYGECAPGLQARRVLRRRRRPARLRGLRRRREHRHALSVRVQEAHRQLAPTSSTISERSVRSQDRWRPSEAAVLRRATGMAIAKSLLASIGACDL